MKPKAIIFDAYGTLFDVHSIARRVERISGDPQALSVLWRQKQVEYTWRRALMGRYVDFWDVTGEALRWAVEKLRIKASEEDLNRLTQGYLSPEIFADVTGGLDVLKVFPLAILSNGSPSMLDAAVSANDLGGRAHVISVDQVKTYKPSLEVYELGTKAFSAPAGNLLFVSSNAWDVAGAKAFGYQVCWCNRSGDTADCLGFEPDFSAGGLDQIGHCLK